MSHSMVWKYFEKCDKIEAMCSICLKRLKMAGGTSNMRQHLKYKHPECLMEENDQEDSSSRKIRTTTKRRLLLRESPASLVEAEDENTLNIPTSSASGEILSKSSPNSSRQRILLEVQAKVPRNEYRPTKNVTKERELQMELLQLEVYKSRLQCRKLEIELNLPKSDLTSEIEDPHVVVLNPSEYNTLVSDATNPDEDVDA